MKEEIYNENELKAMEEEIRSMGIPYSANEPDERYFANFRVHLMERIEAKQEKQNIFASAWTWLVSSPLRYLSLGATLAGVVVAVMLMLMRPTSEPQVAVVQPTQTTQPKVETPSVVAPKEIQHDVAVAPITHQAEPKHIQKANIAVKEKPNTTFGTANKVSDFASMDATLSNTESEAPVNMENLSESELESVIAIAEDMK